MKARIILFAIVLISFNAMGIPVISFSSDDIQKTADELKEKGVKFKKDPVKTDFGYEAIFDDSNGNYIQLI